MSPMPSKVTFTVEEVNAFLQQIPVPAGFTATLFTHKWEPTDEKEEGQPSIRFSGPGIEIEVWGDLTVDWVRGSGHTRFAATPDGPIKYGYDRRGIGDSFYVDADATPEAVGESLKEELEKIVKSRERIANSVPIPGLPFGGWTVTPALRSEVTKVLKAGKSYQFSPSGFGTGLRILHRRSDWTKPMPREFGDFFGITKPLYYETVDCD